MKRILSYILLLILLVSLTACGGNPAADPADSGPAAEPEAAAPSEPERTWFERSGLSFTPTGEISFSTSLGEDGQTGQAAGSCALGIMDNGDGTKTLWLTFEHYAQRIDGEFYSGWANYGFVDQLTGTAVLCKTAAPKTFTIDWNGQTYPLTVQMTDAKDAWIEDDTVKSEGYRVLSLTCPIEYSGAAFFVCGSSETVEEHLTYNSTKPLELIGHGDYDILLFDANLSLETSEENEGNHFQTQETAGSLILGEENLTVSVKDSRSAVITISGLSLQDSYLTNLSTSKRNDAEYSWSVDILGNQNAYNVSTRSFAFEPGAEVRKNLSDMQHSLSVEDGSSWIVIGDVDMSYSPESITWTFTIPEEYPFDFDKVTSYEVRILDVSQDLLVHRSYTA